jgi:hypothetical protein
MRDTCPNHLILLDLRTLIFLVKSANYGTFIMQSSPVSFYLGQNIPLSTLFPNILNALFCSRGIACFTLM